MLRDPRRWDVIVVGAGAAGIAAARHLEQAGARVLVLEARDRVGGRAFSLREVDLPVPIELGAEFVHGDTPHTRALFATLGAGVADVPDQRARARRGRITRMDSFGAEMTHALAGLDPERSPDRPAAVALAQLRRPERRRLALDWVEGLQAADPARVSERAMGRAKEGEDSAGRTLDGYGVVLARAAAPLTLRLGQPVHAVRWQRGRVVVDHGRGERSHARAVVVTVPVGVLHAPAGSRGSITFDPEPSATRRALAGLEMGDAVHLVLRLRAPLGELTDHPDVTFFHTDDPVFRVWWTTAPVRSPIAVAWVGGPTAWSLEPSGLLALARRAQKALREQLGVRSPVAGAWLHHWGADPFARGAYAFSRVGGADGGTKLARPVEGTLFFAGEATSSKASGTVEGALASGARAARQVLRSL